MKDELTPRCTEVQCSGRRRFADGALAHVRTPAVQQALLNHYFDSLGLPRLGSLSNANDAAGYDSDLIILPN
jgi:hypothetical protein